MQNVDDYIKGVLIVENPVISLFKDRRGDIDFLESAFEPIAVNIRIFITEDRLSPHDALKHVLVTEFGSHDIDLNRLNNCSARIGMLTAIIDEDLVKELSR